MNPAPTNLIPVNNWRTAGCDGLEGPEDTFADRIARLTAAKRQSVGLARWLEANEAQRWQLPWSPDHVARDLRTCGQMLVFRESADSGSRLAAATLCQRHLICSMCAIRRSARMLRRYIPLVADAVSRQHSPWLVTLTVRDGESLSERFEHLRDGMRTLHREATAYRRFKHEGKGRARHWTPAGDWLGAIYACEAKRGKGSGLWHPHAHYVALLPDGYSVCGEALSDAWRRITGDSFIVDARPFRSCSALTGDESAEELLDAIGPDLVEVCKYAVKFAGLPPQDLIDALGTLRGRRLLGRIGSMHGWDLAPEYLDTPLDESDVPYVETIARWSGTDYALTSSYGPGPAGDSAADGGWA